MSTETGRHGAANVGDAERWASLAAGAALLIGGLRTRGPAGMAMGILGAALTYRGATGHCPAYQAAGVSTAGPRAGQRPGEGGIFVAKSVTVNRAPRELYDYWRDFQNLPRFMSNLVAVQVQDATHSHWTARAPAGRTVEWDAEVVADKPGSLIAWRSLPSAEISHSGSVRFVPAPGGRGAEVKVEMQYNPPGGALGATVARLYRREPSQEIEDDLRRFKQMMETGEVPRTDGQPSGPPE